MYVIYQMTYLSGQNFTCTFAYHAMHLHCRDGYNVAVATEQHANEKLLVYYFPDFHIISFPVHMSVVAAVRQTQINQIQMKTKASSTARKVGRLSLFLLVIWFVFPKCTHY